MELFLRFSDGNWNVVMEAILLHKCICQVPIDMVENPLACKQLLHLYCFLHGEQSNFVAITLSSIKMVLKYPGSN